MRYFDTAPHYGLGLSERRLGAALASRPRERLRALVEGRAACSSLSTSPAGWTIRASSCRLPTGGVWDFSREGIRRSLEESLERLGLDRLDIVYLHDPDEHWTEVLATGYAALEELRSDGIVGAIGAGMNQSTMLADLVRETDLDVVMLAGRYTLLEQDALDDLLPLCCERRVAVVAAGVFNSGLLARARPSRRRQVRLRRSPGRLVERARAIARICGRHGTTLPAAALAFPLGHRQSQAFASAHDRRTQMPRNEALYGEAIAPDLWSELKAEGSFATTRRCPARRTHCPALAARVLGARGGRGSSCSAGRWRRVRPAMRSTMASAAARAPEIWS